MKTMITCMYMIVDAWYHAWEEKKKNKHFHVMFCSLS